MGPSVYMQMCSALGSAYDQDCQLDEIVCSENVDGVSNLYATPHQQHVSIHGSSQGPGIIRLRRGRPSIATLIGFMLGFMLSNSRCTSTNPVASHMTTLDRAGVSMHGSNQSLELSWFAGVDQSWPLSSGSCLKTDLNVKAHPQEPHR